MIRMWCLHPQYIDNSMLVDTYCNGLRIFKLWNRENYRDAHEDRRYLEPYFMYHLINGHPTKLLTLSRYLFNISEELVHNRGIEVDLSKLARFDVHSFKKSNNGIVIPDQQRCIERETLLRRLKTEDCDRYERYKDLPDTAFRVNPVFSTVQVQLDSTPRSQIQGYLRVSDNFKIDKYSVVLSSTDIV